jgi:hypothetical protein
MKKLKKVLVRILLHIILIIQVSYVALLEGYVLWLLQRLTVIGQDSKYLILVLICFIPNYIYTCMKACPIIKDVTQEDDEDAS